MKIGSNIKIENIRMGVTESNDIFLYGRGSVDGISRIFKADKDFNIVWVSDVVVNGRASYFTIYNDTLYSVTDIGDDLYTSNINDGVTTHLFDGDVYWGSGASGIVIDNNDGNIIVSSGSSSKVYKFNPDTKTTVWSSPTLGTIDIRSMSYNNTDSIYVGHGSLEKLNTSDGTSVWEVKNVDGVNISSFTAVEFKDGFIYSTGSSRICKHDENGNLVWISTAPLDHGTSNIYGLSVNNNGEIATAGYDGTVIKYDTQGNKIWQSEVVANRLYQLVLTDEGYIYTSSLSSLHKIDPNGNLLGQSYDTYYSYGLYIR